MLSNLQIRQQTESKLSNGDCDGKIIVEVGGGWGSSTVKGMFRFLYPLLLFHFEYTQVDTCDAQTKTHTYTYHLMWSLRTGTPGTNTKSQRIGRDVQDPSLKQ